MSNRKQRTLPRRTPRAISRKVVRNPNKGQNSLGSPSLINDKEWASLYNIEFDEGGVLRKRSGYTTEAGGLTGAKGLGNLVTESVNQLCTVDNGVFSYRTSGSWSTDATVSFSTSAETDYTQARGKLYIWNGNAGGAEWDGTTLARPGTMPRGSFSVFYQSYHIASGVTGQPSRIYMSVLADASDFTNASTTLNNSTEVPGATVFSGTGANFVDIAPQDGDSIKGLGIFQDTLIIFKEFAIYQMTIDDSGDPIVTPITRATGCVSHKSIIAVENDLYFLSREGVRFLGNEPNFFNSIRTTVLSARIEGVTNSINPEYFTKCVGFYYDNKYMLSIPTSDSGMIDKILTYDRRYQAWSIWYDMNATAFAKYKNSTNEIQFLFLNVDGSSLKKWTPGTYADDGAAITANATSKTFDFNTPDVTKYFVDLGLIFRKLRGYLTVTVYVDDDISFGSGTIGGNTNDGMGLVMLGESPLGTGTSSTADTDTFSDSVRRVVIGTNSTSIKFKIENARVNENFVLLGYIHAFYPYSHYTFDSTKKIYL